MANLEKLVEQLGKLTVLEAAELTKLLEEEWGVSAAAPVATVAATAGGADTLGLPVGRLAAGCKFDALHIAAGSPASGLRYWPGRTGDEQWFEKIVLNATPGDIRRTWVDGREVASKGER